MKMQRPAIIVLLTYMLISINAAAAGTISSKFNFYYALEGDTDIAPSQIFDNGTQIFLQFNQQAQLPEFYLDDGQGKPLTTPTKSELQSPYIVIHTLTPRLHLNLGQHHAVLVNQSMKQPKGLISSTKTLGAIFASKKEAPTKDLISPSNLAPSNANTSQAKLIFQVRDREALSQALRNFLEAQGWRLLWNTPDDFVIHSAYVLYGSSLPQLINNVLSEFKLTAKYSGNAVIVSAHSP